MAKKKKPAMMFYTADWLSDHAVRALSPAGRGVLIDLLCLMDKDDTYELTKTPEEFARIVGCLSMAEWESALIEIERNKALDVTASSENVTLKSRRLERDHKVRHDNNLRQRRHRDRCSSNEKVTSRSSCSSSCTSTDTSESGDSDLCPPSDLDNECDAFVEAWNVVAKSNGTPTLRVPISASRKAKLKRRLRDPHFRTNWTAALAEVKNSPFLCGEGGRESWGGITFEFFMRPDSVARILEGQFAGGRVKTAGKPGQSFWPKGL